MKTKENGDRFALKVIADFLSIPTDELGNPYRIQEPHGSVHDWDPLADDGDTFRLLMELPITFNVFPWRADSHAFSLLFNQAAARYMGPEYKGYAASNGVDPTQLSPEDYRAMVRRSVVYTALAYINSVREYQAKLAEGKVSV